MWQFLGLANLVTRIKEFLINKESFSLHEPCIHIFNTIVS